VNLLLAIEKDVSQVRLETAEYIRRRIGTRISCYGMVYPEEVNNIIFNIISELKELNDRKRDDAEGVY